MSPRPQCARSDPPPRGAGGHRVKLWVSNRNACGEGGVGLRLPVARCDQGSPTMPRARRPRSTAAGAGSSGARVDQIDAVFKAADPLAGSAAKGWAQRCCSGLGGRGGPVPRNGPLQVGAEHRAAARPVLGAGLAPSNGQAWRRGSTAQVTRVGQIASDRHHARSSSSQLHRRGSFVGLELREGQAQAAVRSAGRRTRLADQFPAQCVRRQPLLAGLQRPHAGDLNPAHHDTIRQALVVVARAGAGRKGGRC